MKATDRGRPSVGRKPANGWVSAESVRRRQSVTPYSDAFSPNLRGYEQKHSVRRTVRTDDTATASLEKPALSVFPMSLTEALVEQGVLSLKSLWPEFTHLR